MEDASNLIPEWFPEYEAEHNAEKHVRGEDYGIQESHENGVHFKESSQGDRGERSLHLAWV